MARHAIKLRGSISWAALVRALGAVLIDERERDNDVTDRNRKEQCKWESIGLGNNNNKQCVSESQVTASESSEWLIN